MTVTIVEKQAGLILNIEVLDVLYSRGADSTIPADPPRERDPSPGEVQTLEALKLTAATNQNRESIKAFKLAVKDFGLTKAEMLMLVNDVPDTLVHIHVIVEDCEERYTPEQIDSLLELLNTHLGSSRPIQTGGEEEEGEEEEHVEINEG
mmetsp:Transcript_19738/g.37615  ORF Transcript_19738/g.37615 Transcript_19738/m.37615 type:complete len:150 (-) Transcript_19738:278-727(-)|eukprot:CAMPEP_0114236608 /NCGR_PEP_ID=MMETSP0058-20121206/6932_1 /TAXON_ID=36894 /ORGANISM="Pyramimonas parkeae, CCMP726" /LENGTH=149 /DNA_ID=CAMNT_0001348563 /DNA_START=285 /DNA_END=734 /DNA_ORIENTATION=+